LVHINTRFSLPLLLEENGDNGGPSIQEPNLSEHGPREIMLFPTTMEDNSESTNKSSSDHGEMNTTKRSHTSQEADKILDLQLDTALMFTELETEMTKKSFTGFATMVLIKLGTLTENHFTTEDIH